MRNDVGSAVTLLIGIVTLRVATSGLMLNYVKPAMEPWLIASGALLCFLGVVGFLRATRARRPADDHEHHHDHPPSRAAWMLLLPVFAASLITPQALGSFAAERRSAVTSQAPVDWAPLAEPVEGAVEMTLAEFSDRAFTDRKRSLDGATVRLIGFVTPPDPESEASFVLNRFSISCCAADARAIQVEVLGSDAAPRPDTWLEVTGVWRETDAAEDDLYPVPALDARTVEAIAQPTVPYE